MKKNGKKTFELPNLPIDRLINWHIESLEILKGIEFKKTIISYLDDCLAVATDPNEREQLNKERQNASYYIAEQTKRYNNKKEIYIKY
jgi:hypothetical protein